MKKGLTMTILFEAQSLNYDEGFGNLSQLKKLRRGDGETYTFSSRQSLRYSIFTQGCQQFGWKPYKVVEAGKGENKVTQAAPNVTLINSEEYDLFGSMQTNVPIDEKKEKEVTITRIAPVRILPAIALEPFLNDVEMLTNKYQADKIQEDPNISNSEQHRSLYRYTIVIDLDRIGSNKDEFFTKVSPNKGIDLKKENDKKIFEGFVKNLREENKVEDKERADRIIQLLEVIKTLWRDIRGRREDLKPLFIVGGVYANKNPFFQNVILVEWKKGKPEIVLEPLKQALQRKYTYLDDNDEMQEALVADETFIGIVDGKFDQSTNDLKVKFTKVDKNQNREKINSNNDILGRIMDSPDVVFDKFKDKVRETFGVKVGTI